MEGEAKSLVREMMASIETWVNEIVAEAETVTDAAGAKRRNHPDSQEFWGVTVVCRPAKTSLRSPADAQRFRKDGVAARKHFRAEYGWTTRGSGPYNE